MSAVKVTGSFTFYHKDIAMQCVDVIALLDGFVSSVASAKEQYAHNTEELHELQGRQQDLLHEIELVDGKNACEGWKLYAALRDMRLERRRCKCENEFLKQFVEWANANEDTIRQLSALLKVSKEKRSAIDSRVYGLRCRDTSQEE